MDCVDFSARTSECDVGLECGRVDPSHVEDPGIASARSMLRVTKEFVEDFACARACKAVGGARLVSEMMRIISQRIAAYQGRSESSVGVRGENQGEAAWTRPSQIDPVYRKSQLVSSCVRFEF